MQEGKIEEVKRKFEIITIISLTKKYLKNNSNWDY